MYYCSREHQLLHRKIHKKSCGEAKKAREAFDDQEKKSRGVLGERFETSVGEFVKSPKNQAVMYLGARVRLAETMLAMNTFDAVQKSYEHFRDLVRLCRDDDMGLREQMPRDFFLLIIESLLCFFGLGT